MRSRDASKELRRLGLHCQEGEQEMTDGTTWSATCIQIVSHVQHQTVCDAHHAPLGVTAPDSASITGAHLIQTEHHIAQDVTQQVI